MMDTAFEFLKLGMVGLIAGLFSSVIANRDHRQRKWWELRVGAYQNAIEALSDIVYYYDKHYSAEIEDRELREGFKKQLDTYWDESFPKVRKFADSGAFLFSERANEALREFMRNDDEPTYIDHLDNNLTKAKRCLSELIECSKADLRLKPGLMKWLY